MKAEEKGTWLDDVALECEETGMRHRQADPLAAARLCICGVVVCLLISLHEYVQ